MKVETHSTCRLSDKSLSPIRSMYIRQNIPTSERADRSRKIRLCIRVLELQGCRRLQLDMKKKRKLIDLQENIALAVGFSVHFTRRHLAQK